MRKALLKYVGVSVIAIWYAIIFGSFAFMIYALLMLIMGVAP